MALSMRLYSPTTDPDARQSTLNAIRALRYQVYVKEMGKPYRNADHVHGRLLDEFDLGSLHLVVADQGNVTGSVMLSPFETWRLDRGLRRRIYSVIPDTNVLARSFFVSRLVVLRNRPGHMRTAIALMQRAYATAQAYRMAIGLCHTRTELLPLFLKFGWRVVGQPFLHRDSNTTQHMLCVSVLDPDTLKAKGSPFLAPDERISAHVASFDT